MLDLVWYSIFDIRFECWIEFYIRYSTFDLNVGLSLIFDIRHSIWMLDLVWYSIFDIRFECWIKFDIRYSTFDLNVGFSLIFDIRHSKFECWILNIEHRTNFWLLCGIHLFRFCCCFILFKSHFYLTYVLISIVIKRTHVPTRVVRVKCICSYCPTPTRLHRHTYEIL